MNANPERTMKAASIYEQVKAHRGANYDRDLPFNEIEYDGTIAELHAELVTLARAKKISLRPWTGAMSDCPDPEYIHRVEFAPGFSEDLFYARLIG